jgi:hypothetical protein
MRSVPVLGYVERVRHAVVLRLQSDLDNLHRRDDGNGLGDAGGEACEEEALARDHLGLLVHEQLLIPLERRETDGHFRDNTREDRPETLVQAKGCLLAHDLNAGADETPFGHAWLPPAP